MAERGEDYSNLYGDLNVRRMLGEETDLEDSQEELLGAITVAPAKETSEAVLAAVNSKGSREKGVTVGAHARGCQQILIIVHRLFVSSKKAMDYYCLRMIKTSKWS